MATKNARNYIMVVAHGRWLLTRKEPRGVSSVKKSRHTNIVVNSLIVTTSHKHPSPIRDEFVNICFVSQTNTSYFKNSLVSDWSVLNFLNDCNPPLGHKFDIPVCLLFLVREHLAWSHDCKKPLLKCHKSSVLNSTDQACWQVVAIDLQK